MFEEGAVGFLVGIRKYVSIWFSSGSGKNQSGIRGAGLVAEGRFQEKRLAETL